MEGYVAALTAALEEPVADVRLLVRDDGRFCHEPGWIDLLGYPPADGDTAGDDDVGPVREPLQEPFAALADLPEDHPYSRAGIEGVRRALSLFEELSGYEGLESDANALVATATGEVTPTFLYPDSVASGLASDGRETLLVGFERIVDFDAALAAAKLDEFLPYDVGHTTIELDVEVGGAEPAKRFAAVLDDNAELDGELPARRAVAGKIRNELDIEPRIGFPAVLGRTDADEVRSDLEAILQADVFEVPLGPPSMPGLRLADRLRSELDVGAGGLRADRERIREPAFGCHVAQPADRADWVAEGFLDDQPFARAGLAVDDEFRPLDADGTPEFENLRAAGRVLGGADVAAEQSTGGVAVVTGYAAGQLAAEW
ncbi:anaerobic glycerol-3-phosphate dehydrogenase subunit B [Halobacteriales archaeon QH_7_66_37]|nr:MAG: anaerobic glycerol-3-phosphate dehydrogenase subunit B [Halobacteriales archaeon QH_7_66_37]